MTSPRSLLLSLVFACLACSGAPNGGPADAGGDSGTPTPSDAGAGDAGVADAGAADAGGVADAGLADAGVADAGVADAGVADAGSADAGSCTGPCRLMTVQARFGAVEAPFTRAQFGLTSPAQGGIPEWGLHVELHAGGDVACPTQSSPTPDRTVVLAGLKLPLDAGQLYGADAGLKSTLLDFKGALVSVPFLRARETSVLAGASRACDTCASGEMYLSFELDARFDAGTITGHVYAEHCPSLDLR